MNCGRAIHIGVVLIALTAALSGAGCSSPGSEVAPGGATESTSSAIPTSTAQVPGAGMARPDIAEAEAAVLMLAKVEYPSIPMTEVSIGGMGQDSEGRWWVQGFTPSAGYETEQWFVTFDGSDWIIQGYGTGLDRSDFPAGIAWEDVQ
ncbi:MAG: hypothetical protein Q8M66_01210 [Actinomycetota bacterium]|nr:hypothetical protein [Actinomycetota bacterium]MDZ4179595.1 hypothetical protein [Coriobacteriia bacterium]